MDSGPTRRGDLITIREGMRAIPCHDRQWEGPTNQAEDVILIALSSFSNDNNSLGASHSTSNFEVHSNSPLWYDPVIPIDIYVSFSSEDIFRDLLNSKPQV